MLAIFDTNQDISLAEINIKFTKCSNNTVAIVYSKQVVILFFECKGHNIIYNIIYNICGATQNNKFLKRLSEINYTRAKRVSVY